MNGMNMWATAVGWIVFGFAATLLLAGVVISTVELLRAVTNAVKER